MKTSFLYLPCLTLALYGLVLTASPKGSDAKLIVEILSSNQNDEKGISEGLSKVSQLPNGKEKQILTHFLNASIDMLKNNLPFPEAVVAVVNSLLDFAELPNPSDDTRKAAIKSSQRLIRLTDLDLSEVIVQRLRNLVSKMIMTHPSDVDYRFFTTYFDDPFSQDSVKSTLGHLQECKRLMPSNRSCEEMARQYQMRVSARKCDSTKIVPGMKLELHVVSINEQGTLVKRSLATLPMEKLVRGFMEEKASKRLAYGFSPQGVRVIKQSVEKVASKRVDATLVLNKSREELGEVNGLFSVSTEFFRLGDISIDQVCRAF